MNLANLGKAEDAMTSSFTKEMGENKIEKVKQFSG